MNNLKARHICLISGGKDSSALALYLRDKYPEIDMEYVFNDTHKELDETYEYLSRIEAYLNKKIIRTTSKLSDRGFDHWLKMYKGYLPSPQTRWCTRKLKIEPFEEFIGDDLAFLYIGIRADENREGLISTKPNITPVYPFKEDGITKEDVIQILEDSAVGMPDYYKWRSRSGCYFCFFQRKIEWVGLLENHPDLFEKAKEYEKPEEGFTWVENESLEELSQSDRVEQIKAEYEIRQKQLGSRKKPRTLAQMWTGELSDDESGCLICHL